MSKWLSSFVEKRALIVPDKTDKVEGGINLSGLSVPPRGLFLANGENRSTSRPDKTDKVEGGVNLSGLSVPPEGLFLANGENRLPSRPDKPDKVGNGANLSGLSVPSGGHLPGKGPLDVDSLLYEFEERLAIAEYDGCQNEIQAERIAYQDAFISVLNALPDDQERDLGVRRWLDQRIKASQDWLEQEGVLSLEINDIPLVK